MHDAATIGPGCPGRRAEGLDPALAQRLTQAYGQLRPWPEAPRVLAAIAAAMPIGTVTNCSDELGRQAAGLAGVPFEVTVTAQSAGAYKPYRRALDALALPAGRVLFVAGSPYDISGAGQVGMDAWWRNRVGMPARPGPRPVAEHRSLRPLPAFCVLAAVGPLCRDLRCDDAPGDGDAAAGLAEPRRGADDDTEPAGADVPAAGGHVHARELVAAHLGERLRGGYAGERGEARTTPPCLIRVMACGATAAPAGCWIVGIRWRARMPSPVVRAAPGRVCRQVLIQPGRQLGRAERGAARSGPDVPGVHFPTS
jgi:hypothetical protein